MHWPTIFSVALFPVIVLVYWLLARSEKSAFSQNLATCRAYQRRVPMFIPRLRQWGQLIEEVKASEPELPPR